MKILTRSANPALHTMMQSLLSPDNEFKRLTQFQGWEGALDYLKHVFLNGSGWIVSIDEDCFVTDEPAIKRIIQHMKDNDYQLAGIRDGGVIEHRINSWTNINPFFFIANVDKIREKLQWEDWEKLKTYYPKFIPNDPPKGVSSIYSHGHFEPFAGLLYWLWDNFRIKFIDAETHKDGVSTVLKLDNKPFALHSWYSREYDGAHKERIDNLFNEAKEMKR